MPNSFLSSRAFGYIPRHEPSPGQRTSLRICTKQETRRRINSGKFVMRTIEQHVLAAGAEKALRTLVQYPALVLKHEDN